MLDATAIAAAGHFLHWYLADVVGVMQVKTPNAVKSVGLVVSRDRMPT